MKICALIVEYNPLHNGHLYHIKKSKEITNASHTIAIMSGNFVQRGLPAIIDKFQRTTMALNCGVDLVIELPSIYALSSAEFFSFGAVSLIHQLNVVDYLCFGSECGDINKLLNLSRILSFEDNIFKESLKNELSKGIPFHKARENVLVSLGYIKDSDLSILNSSNNILALEYCKSILKLNSKIKPFTIKRSGADYNSESLNNLYSSATSIRQYIKTNEDISNLQNHLPNYNYSLLKHLKESNYDFPKENDMLPFLKYKIIHNSDSLNNLPEAKEGLYNKIIKSIGHSSSINDCILNIKSKRYTYSRINRLLTQYFIGFDEYDYINLREQKTPYARILGFNDKGKEILKLCKKNSSIPLITKIPKTLTPCLDLDIKSTLSYSLLNKSIEPYSDFTTSPIIK